MDADPSNQPRREIDIRGEDGQREYTWLTDDWTNAELLEMYLRQIIEVFGDRVAFYIDDGIKRWAVTPVAEAAPIPVDGW